MGGARGEDSGFCSRSASRRGRSVGLGNSLPALSLSGGAGPSRGSSSLPKAPSSRSLSRPPCRAVARDPLCSSSPSLPDPPCLPTISATCSELGTGTHSVMFTLFLRGSLSYREAPSSLSSPRRESWSKASCRALWSSRVSPPPLPPPPTPPPPPPPLPLRSRSANSELGIVLLCAPRPRRPLVQKLRPQRQSGSERSGAGRPAGCRGFRGSFLGRRKEWVAPCGLRRAVDAGAPAWVPTPGLLAGGAGAEFEWQPRAPRVPGWLATMPREKRADERQQRFFKEPLPGSSTPSLPPSISAFSFSAPRLLTEPLQLDGSGRGRGRRNVTGGS